MVMVSIRIIMCQPIVTIMIMMIIFIPVMVKTWFIVVMVWDIVSFVATNTSSQTCADHHQN